MSQIDIRGIKIYYEVLGNIRSPETVVFLNGVMTSTASWSYQTPIFEKHGYKILLHDFRGQLLSEKPEGPYSFRIHAEDTIGLFDQLGIEKAHLIGTSYGGEVGMRIAIDFPDRVKSLSIIDSVSELDELLRSNVNNWKRLAEKGNFADFFWGLVPSCYSSYFIERNLSLLKFRAVHVEHFPQDFFAGQIRLYEAFLADLNMTPELNKIQAPSLVICGEDDILKPPRFSKIIARNIPDSEFVIIPDCGHVTILEQHRPLNSMLLGFVMKHSEK
ncbi:MAG: alpha/beta fold hydrolase [Candidatus Riflebacteria bacterium]|nr:alpha/beta fold hydrolase [Candidatus Riflebacteria bacterium]